MGNPVEPGAEGYRRAESPPRAVVVEEFWIGRFLVTAEEFCLFLNEAGNRGYFLEELWHYEHRTIQLIGEAGAAQEPRAPRARPLQAGDRYAPHPGAERSPAYPVTWVGATAYCQWLSRKLGHEFRLPTEAEWELAARGPEGRDWPWGTEPPLLVDYSERMSSKRWLTKEASKPRAAFRVPDPIDEVLPFDELYGPRWIVRRWDQRPPWMTEPVGSFPKNATPNGVYDMLGHDAGQWCSDRAEHSIERLPDTPEPMYVTRGRSTVVVGYDERRKRTMGRWLWWVMVLAGGRPRRLGTLGDAAAGESDNTYGRSWSRVGEHEPAGQMFRLASSVPLAGAAGRQW